MFSFYALLCRSKLTPTFFTRRKFTNILCYKLDIASTDFCHPVPHVIVDCLRNCLSYVLFVILVTVCGFCMCIV